MPKPSPYLDRRFVYVFVAIALAVPLIFHWSLPPAQMATADEFYKTVDGLLPEKGKIALVSMDWGPGTQAENEAQTVVAMEHLMRKRIPFAVISTYQYAAPFLDAVPKKVAKALHQEMPEQEWIYGRDWVNFGFRPNGLFLIAGIAKAQDIQEFLKTDASGTPLGDLTAMQGVRDIRNVQLLLEFTGLSGVFSNWLQFFQAQGYRPPFLHGCTSITIPEAYIYFDSKQILGLHEGIAGAAWYEKLLSDHYPGRKPGLALQNNTSLAYAHLVVIAFIVLGNIGDFVNRNRQKSLISPQMVDAREE